ncbi:MAG: hypothetical protein GY850_15810 [bacterium]|nr:hypothetical protein [bacterium]
MSHLDQMTGRLPHLYKDGELLRMVLALPALNLEVFDEQALEIQRSHWFDTAVEFEDVAKIAALLDLQPETWQGLREFRAWVHSLRNAWLKNGAVTRQPLQDFVDEYTNRYQAAVRINAVTSLGNWSNEPSQTRPALVENPLRRKYEQLPAGTPIEPLHQQLVLNRGLDESVGDFFIMGLAGGKEYMPVIANTTTGQALIYTGIIGAGDRLWLQTLSDNTVKAYTAKLDVSDRLYSIDTLQPGVSWEGADAQRPAQALNLRPGDNNLWFLPVAHYDKPGLDRALLGLAELTLEQGRWDETRLDQSLYYQDPMMILWASWQESQPASIEITLPGGILINSAGQTETALENRDRLQFSLNLGIQKIKAAGISATTRVLAFSDVQPSCDALCDIYPKTFREAGSSGIDSLPDSGGAFDVTEQDKSVYR